MPLLLTGNTKNGVCEILFYRGGLFIYTGIAVIIGLKQKGGSEQIASLKSICIKLIFLKGGERSDRYIGEEG